MVVIEATGQNSHARLSEAAKHIKDESSRPEQQRCPDTAYPGDHIRYAIGMLRWIKGDNCMLFHMKMYYLITGPKGATHIHHETDNFLT